MCFLAKLILCATLVVLIPDRSVAREIVINAVGDIMLAGSATPVFNRLGYDFPFAATAEELLPLNVQNREVHFQPQVLSGKKGQKVIDHLTRISRRWNTLVSATDGRFMVRFHRDGTLAWK